MLVVGNERIGFKLLGWRLLLHYWELYGSNKIQEAEVDIVEGLMTVLCLCIQTSIRLQTGPIPVEAQSSTSTGLRV